MAHPYSMDLRERVVAAVAAGATVREAARTFIVVRIAQKPDLTVRALQAELEAEGIEASRNTVWLCLRSERLSCKKNRVRSRTDAAKDGTF